MTYEHTQSEVRLVVVVGVGAAVVTLLAVVADAPLLFLTAGIAAFVALVGFSLSSMTISVGPDEVLASYRWGWPKRSIRRSDISSVRQVRSAWWHGIGVRFVPGATLYNVWGLDAVHIELDGKRDVRLGTDDPEGLVAALA